MTVARQNEFESDCSRLQVAFTRFWKRSWEIISINWHLGFTAFGGPAVHFQLARRPHHLKNLLSAVFVDEYWQFHEIFVQKHQWIDDKFYQEIFAISQALPGPASTKVLFCINYHQGGILAAVITFLMWSLPGAIGMYGLSMGVSRVGDTLPAPVYALLSGLNAATVGIIFYAAAQLAKRAITDKLTRILVFLGAAIGTLYAALWLFPVILLCAGLSTLVWDSVWMQHTLTRLEKRRSKDDSADEEKTRPMTRNGLNAIEAQLGLGPYNRDKELPPLPPDSIIAKPSAIEPEKAPTVLSARVGAIVIIGFMATFVSTMVIRGLVVSPPRAYSLFANLYLTGTIIFGGGPVVIPLLHESIVGENWVSSRDFILGLALIQCFPGPNFNFAVYLGSLATAGSSVASYWGALIAFVSIFTPGIIIQTGALGTWKVLRSRRWFFCLLRGINATAVGFIYTLVYKLWRIGFIDENNQAGSSLGRDPWWVIVTATSFVGSAWFGLNAPLAILLGAVLGLGWFAVVKI